MIPHMTSREHPPVLNVVFWHPRVFLKPPLRVATPPCSPPRPAAQISDMTAQCKELWRQRDVARKAAKEEGEKSDSWGFFGWGKK